VSQMTTDMVHFESTSGPFLIYDLSPGLYLE